jgi:Ser/Thr protein kinase RdoA (MazF antagonist)
MEGELQRVLSCYNLGALRNARRVECGFVNENWDLETSCGRYFLKRRHPHLRNAGVIRAQHTLIARLRRAGFPAPALIPTADGETLLVLDGEYYEIQGYVEGTPYDHDSPAHFRAAALTLGRYHTLVHGFAPQALRDLSDLYTPAILRTNLIRLSKAWELDLERESELARLTRRLDAHATDLATRFASHGPLPHLVIHGDYYAGNLLFKGDRVVGVVDYDKARWQPRVVELAETLIYFASCRPDHLKHLVYPGFLDWEPFGRFLRGYAQAIASDKNLDENEIHALPDYIRCIWLSISLQRLWEKGPRPPEAVEILCEVLALGDWAKENARYMIEKGDIYDQGHHL